MIQKILSPTKERDSDNKTEVKIIHGDGQERKDIGGSRRGEGSWKVDFSSNSKQKYLRAEGRRA